MRARHLNLVRDISKNYGALSDHDPINDRSLNGNHESCHNPGRSQNLRVEGVSLRSQLIHERAMARAQNYRVAESDLIESLREVDDDRTFERFKCTSLYHYATTRMALSEDVACNLIAIMRKSRMVPELAEAIRDGALTASKARKIVPVINESNKALWLELATTSSSRVIEKAVATENPKLATTESLKYKSADRLELILGVSEEWAEALKCTKDLASQNEARAVSTEEALLTAMKFFNERHDPLAKAKRVQMRKEAKSKSETAKATSMTTIEVSPTLEDPQSSHASKNSNLTGESLSDSQADLIETSAELSVPGRKELGSVAAKVSTRNSEPRKRLPASTKHFVVLRDQRQCTHGFENGQRCEERRWLDVHHIIPRSEGGSDGPENLTTLCSRHHALRHRH